MWSESTKEIQELMKILSMHDKSCDACFQSKELKFNVEVKNTNGEKILEVFNVPSYISFRPVYGNPQVQGFYEIGVRWEDVEFPNYKDYDLYGTYWTDEKFVTVKYNIPDNIVITYNAQNIVLHLYIV